MSTFVLATANAHKTQELREILQPLGVTLLPRPANVPDVVEDGDTLEANALIKARALVAATGHAAIADDTGLFVDALDGAPGVHSARYAGEDATNEENVEKLLVALAHIPSTQRAARFRTVAAVAYPDGSSVVVEGSLEGTIIDDVRGSGGFGYDPVFALADGRTLSELSSQEKNEISHRGRAFRALVEILQIP